MLCLATAMFGIFFFLTIFVQEVLGYSALRSGLAFLPFAATVVVMSGIVSQLVARTGAAAADDRGLGDHRRAACTGSRTSPSTAAT